MCIDEEYARYAKARLAIVRNVLEGQTHRETARQIAQLIDLFPAKADSLEAEAKEWWERPDEQPWEIGQ